FAIFEFNNDHNHSCAQDKHKYLIDRHIPVVYKLMADLNEDCGIPARGSYDTMKKAVGGAENLGFTHTDLKNHIQTRRTRAIENGDVSVLLNHFSSESNSKPGYFYEMQVDCEDQIASIFWVDGQMRMDYQYFGDCISFDTTYRTNRTCRPLGNSIFLILFIRYSVHILYLYILYKSRYSLYHEPYKLYSLYNFSYKIQFMYSLHKPKNLYPKTLYPKTLYPIP
ncbi:Protein FAR1-RELATED SEQUENCE 5, partial [Linum perenne]